MHNLGPHVLVTSAPWVIGFRFPHDYWSAAKRGQNRSNGFSYWSRKFDKAYGFSTVVHLNRSIFPLTNQSLAWANRSAASLFRLQLQITIVMPNYPVISNRAFGFEAENLSQFPARRLAPVIILRLG